jgi:CheY-like chemotaxis protein
VARIVEQLHGQLRAESEVGKGTKFYFTCSMGVNADFRPFGSGGLEQETVGTSNAGPGAYGLQPSAAMATASLDHTKLKSRDGAATPIERSPTPAPVVEAAPPVSPIRSKVGPKGGPQLRVLVVEDDVINSQILQKRLKMDKHAVRAVENGQEAVDLIASDWDFDAVIMDIQMPLMNGFEAAEGIRALEAKTPAPAGIDPVRVDGRMPIFALSASLYEDDRVHLGTHFDGWLLKPLQFNRLRSLLAALLDGEKRAAELYQPGQWERGGYFRDGKKL